MQHAIMIQHLKPCQMSVVFVHSPWTNHGIHYFLIYWRFTKCAEIPLNCIWWTQDAEKIPGRFEIHNQLLYIPPSRFSESPKWPCFSLNWKNKDLMGLTSAVQWTKTRARRLPCHRSTEKDLKATSVSFGTGKKQRKLRPRTFRDLMTTGLCLLSARLLKVSSLDEEYFMKTPKYFYNPPVEDYLLLPTSLQLR